MENTKIELRVVPKTGTAYKVQLDEQPQDIVAWVSENLQQVASFSVVPSVHDESGVTQVILNRCRTNEYGTREVYTDILLYHGSETTDQGVEADLRKAVLRFLACDLKAESDLSYACGDYNWGDWVCGNWDEQASGFSLVYEGNHIGEIARIVSIDVDQDEWPCEGYDSDIDAKLILVHADGTEEAMPGAIVDVDIRSGYVEYADGIYITEGDRVFVESQNCGVRHALRSQSGLWDVDDPAAFFKTE